jgi:hypothetical protein
VYRPVGRLAVGLVALTEEATVAERLEWTLHLTTDRGGNPEFAWLSRWGDEDSAQYWVADAEFGPFDTMLDVGRWCAKQVRTSARSHPV